jgi:ubiquinone/menaquinone biosynthesis C-methylase UbiE
MNKSLWRKTSLALLFLAGSLAFFWLVLFRLLVKLTNFGPCPYSLAWQVDNPVRRRYMGRVLDWVGIRPGERVLEVGPGPGAFTVRAARRAEPGGALVAVDVQAKMIADVQRKLQATGQRNVQTHVADARALPLNDASIDRAFLITVLPEIPAPQRALRELRRVLRPGGVLSVSEEFLSPSYPLARTVVRWAEEAGFVLTERRGSWWIYTLNFRKPV